MGDEVRHHPQRCARAWCNGDAGDAYCPDPCFLKTVVWKGVLPGLQERESLLNLRTNGIVGAISSIISPSHAVAGSWCWTAADLVIAFCIMVFAAAFSAECTTV